MKNGNGSARCSMPTSTCSHGRKPMSSRHGRTRTWAQACATHPIGRAGSGISVHHHGRRAITETRLPAGITNRFVRREINMKIKVQLTWKDYLNASLLHSGYGKVASIIGYVLLAFVGCA